jgi:hypothetical protein
MITPMDAPNAHALNDGSRSLANAFLLQAMGELADELESLGYVVRMTRPS